MPNARVTPWRDSQELEYVGAVLTAVTHESADSIRQAMETIHAWRTRQDPLPHAVDITACLAQCLYREKYDACHSIELRLALSSTVIRCINGLADVLQQQNKNAVSIMALCQQLGIPKWLVDIRHEATHNQLPSLPVLKLAAESLLSYLKMSFWDKISASVEDQFASAMHMLHSLQEEGNIELEGATTVETRISKNIPDIYEDEEMASTVDSDNDDDLMHLGTLSNRFAALQDTKPTPRKSSKRSAKETKKKKKRPTSAPQVLARRFARAELPLDIRFRALSTFLLYGPNAYEGVLLSSKTDNLQAAFDRSKAIYGPLIVEVSRRCKGFPSFLLVSLVDAVITIESAGNLTMYIQRKLVLLNRWIQHMLSKDVLRAILPVSSAKRSLVDQLFELGYPLRSLRRRCHSAERSDTPQSSRQGLLKVFNDILGESLSINEPLPPVSDDMRPASHRSGNVGKLSLEDMEALLENENHHGVEASHSNDDNDEVQQDAWSLCEDWEPCAIGSLPGYL